MKKRIYTWALGAILLAGCSQEEHLTVGEEVKMTFTATMSESGQSRSEASTVCVDKMICAVYTSDGSTELIKEIVEVTQGKATFSPTLMKGETYDFVFWAYRSNGTDNDKNECYDMTEFPVIKFVPQDECNSELLEAYTVAYNDIVIVGTTIDVTLKRPLAQINLIEKVSSWEQSGNDIPCKSIMTIKGCHNRYNALTGQYEKRENEKTDFSFSYTPSIDKLLTTNQDGTNYFTLASGYTLGNNKVKCEIKLLDKEETIQYTFSIFDIPTETNHRTNIYSNLQSGITSYSVNGI